MDLTGKPEILMSSTAIRKNQIQMVDLPLTHLRIPCGSKKVPDFLPLKVTRSFLATSWSLDQGWNMKSFH